jgi:predicted nucleic acid-binding protein
MKTALDSSVILDVVTGDASWADASERALGEAFSKGPLVVCECVLAEIVPALRAGDLKQFMADWRIEFIPSSERSAIAAGRMFEKYLGRGGAARRVLPDFLIGAHALETTRRLLARDRGYYRDYFTGLSLIEPRST